MIFFRPTKLELNMIFIYMYKLEVDQVYSAWYVVSANRFKHRQGNSSELLQYIVLPATRLQVCIVSHITS